MIIKYKNIISIIMGVVLALIFIFTGLKPEVVMAGYDTISGNEPIYEEIKTVHHEEEGHYETKTVVDKAAYDEKVIENLFKDVTNSSNYYYKPVYWASQQGVVKGFGDGTFRPQSNCTRAQMMIMIYRMAGKPSVSGKTSFRDVEGKYSRNSDTYRAILWGSKAGIIKGFPDGSFGPEKSVNRKDTLIMLYRYTGRPGVSGDIMFGDVAIEGYRPSSDTYRAILWGTQKGITKGYSDGNFKPFANCLREHIVTFIYRYAKNVQGRNVNIKYKTVHHDAVTHTEKVWVVDKAAWDETIYGEIVGYQAKVYCTLCKEEFTGTGQTAFEAEANAIVVWHDHDCPYENYIPKW